MILPVLMLLTALQQPSAKRLPPPSVQQRAAEFDSARSIVSAVGFGVADVRSALELYRRAVFNSPDAEVLSTADAFRARCRALDSAAVSGARRMCRSCGSPEVRAALQGYRGILPSVGHVGAQCATKLSRLAGQSRPAQRLRREVWAVGNAIVRGLLPYERRLAVLREAAGWAPSKKGRLAPLPGRR